MVAERRPLGGHAARFAVAVVRVGAESDDAQLAVGESRLARSRRLLCSSSANKGDGKHHQN